MHYTETEKSKILKYEQVHGTMEAHRKFGIAKKTLYNWRHPDNDNAARCKEYYNKTVEKRREASRLYYHENREHAILRNKKYKEDNIERGIINDLLYHSKTRAIKKHIKYDITKDWLEEKLKDGKCEKSGIELVYERKSPYSPSIDRIDSNKGYTKDNCQIVCKIYNYAKNEWSDKDVMILAEALTKSRLTSPTQRDTIGELCQ